MSNEKLTELLRDTEPKMDWGSLGTQAALQVCALLAPQLLALLQQLLELGGGALVAALTRAGAPRGTPDYALKIVQGIEFDHGNLASPDKRWPGTTRAERARDAVARWLEAAGGDPSEANVEQLIEGAWARMRAQQAKVLRQQIDRIPAC